MNEASIDQFESVEKCPICGSSSKREFANQDFREYRLTYCSCNKCGLVYQSSRISETALDEFYAHEYRQIYQGDEKVNNSVLLIQNLRAENLIKFVQGEISKPCSVLDIGCSSGVLLKQFEDEFACDIAGVEPGQRYREYAESLGVDVFSSVDILMQERKTQFDLIVLAHVLEHLPSPVSFLNNIREKLLAENGLLLIEVPNLYGHDSFELAHFITFSQRSLLNLLAKTGFKLDKVNTHGFPRSRILPLYITALFSPVTSESIDTKTNIKPEYGIMIKRKTGMFFRKVMRKILPRLAWVPNERMS